MQFNWKNGICTVRARFTMECRETLVYMHVPISICLRFVSLIQIEYAFDYVILFALNEKWSAEYTSPLAQLHARLAMAVLLYLLLFMLSSVLALAPMLHVALCVVRWQRSRSNINWCIVICVVDSITPDIVPEKSAKNEKCAHIRK